jgi:transcriptional regulator with XRE-family HTH domain
MQGFDIKIARMRAGLKQYEVAAMVGIPQTTLCEIEANKRSVSPQLLGKILDSINRAILLRHQEESQNGILFPEKNEVI